jgi:hypothetical protein
MPTVAQMISILTEAERNIQRVKQIGDDSVKQMREAKSTLEAISDGIPDKALVEQAEERCTKVDGSFSSVLGLTASISRVRTAIPKAFGRR